MSDHAETQDDFLGAFAAQATGTEGVPDDVSESSAMPNDLADDVEAHAEHAALRDAHLAKDVDDGEQLESDQDEQVDDNGKRKQHVPLGALQEERQRRQQVQAQLQQAQQERAILEDRMNQFLQFQQQQQQQQQAQLQTQQQQPQPQPQPQEEQIPDFSEDPEAYIKAKFAQLEQAQQQQQQAQVQQQQYEQAHREVVQLTSSAAQVEAAYRAEHPDYDQAWSHLEAEVDSRIRQMHPHASDAQHQVTKQSAMLAFLQQCAQRGDNPCELIYNKAREMGFQGTHRAPARQAPTSLSNVGGASRAPDQRGSVRAEDVAGMSQTDFDRLWAQMASGAEPKFFR